jgi:uncharacterized protein
MTEKEKNRMKIRLAFLLKRSGISKASIFGSFARGEAGKNSDIDLLVEMKKGKSLLDLAGLKIRLQDSLGRKVDVLTYNSLHPLLKERILKEQEKIL